MFYHNITITLHSIHFFLVLPFVNKCIEALCALGERPRICTMHYCVKETESHYFFSFFPLFLPGYRCGNLDDQCQCPGDAWTSSMAQICKRKSSLSCPFPTAYRMSFVCSIMISYSWEGWYVWTRAWEIAL